MGRLGRYYLAFELPEWYVISPSMNRAFIILINFAAHPIQVGWNSRNSNTVRSRTVSAACYNMFVQAGGIISSNIYRKGTRHIFIIPRSASPWLLTRSTDDAPNYHRGNKTLLGIAIGNIAIYSLTKVYYVFRNKQRDRKWNAMTEREQLEYLATTKDEGNKRLDFRFAH